MLSEIGERIRKFRAFWSPKPGVNNRKRHLEPEGDSIESPIKRPKPQHESAGDKGKGNTAISSITKMADWVVKKQRSFRDSYYVRTIAKSPTKLMKKISSLGDSEVQPSSTHATCASHHIPNMEMRSSYIAQPGRPDLGPDMIISQMPVHSTPVSVTNPIKGYNFTPDHFDLNKDSDFKFGYGGLESTRVSFQGSNGANIQSRHSPREQLHRPSIRPGMASGSILASDHRGHSVYEQTFGHRPSIRPGMASGSVLASDHRGRSVYERTFGSLAKTYSRYQGHRNRHNMAAKECVRMEEKKKYAELLQKFTSRPLQDRIVMSTRQPLVTSRTSRPDDTYIPGSHVPSNGPSSRTSIAPTPCPLRVEAGQFLTNEKRPSSVEKQTSYSCPTSPRSVRVVIDLAETGGSSSDESSRRSSSPPKMFYVDLTSTGNGSASEVDRSTSGSTSPEIVQMEHSTVIRLHQKPDERVVVGRTPKSVSFSKSVPLPKSDAFLKSLHESGYLQDDWLENLKEKHGSENLKLEREIAEEEFRSQYFKEKREDFDKDIECRIRETLRLSEREPVFLEEPYVEEEEEEEELDDEFPELSEEMESVVDKAWGPYSPDQVLGDAFRLQITRRDLKTLQGHNWLNDEVINFYMNLLMERGSPKNMSSVHAFNTFFYPKIMSGGQASVKRWTRKIDIFAMDYVLVPVHLGVHWCLSVIDFKKKQIRYYDSMGGKNGDCLQALREYLLDESLEKRKKKFDMSQWQLVHVHEQDIPLQQNGSDCGMFTCKYAEYITRDAPITFSQQNMPYFRRRMTYEIISKKLL